MTTRVFSFFLFFFLCLRSAHHQSLTDYICTKDEDCSLNGSCIRSKCVCDPSWVSADCGVLNLLLAKPDNGYNRVASEGISSWGGSIIADTTTANLYHLFVSEIVNKCPTANWIPNSHIVRATSTSPEGPFTYVEEVLPAFSHNPNIVRASDNNYLLYTIGNFSPSPPLNCASGQVYPSWPSWPSESGVVLHVSESLTTKNSWKSYGIVLGNNTNGSWDYDTTNPSALALKNGTVFLMYRGCTGQMSNSEKIGIARAPNWKGPYTRITHSPIFQNISEHPYFWRDARGNWHALVHSLETGVSVGRHAYSKDGLVWFFGSKSAAYNTTVQFTDGKSISYSRRERPQVFFQGNNMIALVTGVQEKGAHGSYTCIQAIAH